MTNPDTTPNANKLGIGRQVGYGMGQIAGQIFRDVPSLLLLFFMTNALGVNPALAGVAIFVPKLVLGVLCDFGVGLLSDRLKRIIARRWWLLLGALASPVAVILVFHVPHVGEQAKAAYVSLAFSFYMLVFATFSVPYLALAGELARTSHERTVIMAWRLVFTALGVLIADGLAPIYIQFRGGGQPAYEQMSYLLAVICPVVLIIAFLGAGVRRGPAIAPPKTAGFPMREALAALASRRFSVLIGANLVQLVGAGMGYASMLYFLTYTLARTDAFKQIGIITLIASAAIIVSQPLWVAVARVAGKKSTYVVASLLYGAVMIAWGVFGRGQIEYSYGFAALLGLSNSGWTLLGFSMISDLGEDGRGGLYSSAWIAADKIGFALGGTLLLGLLLSAFGFDAVKAIAGQPQSPRALTGVLIAFAVVPAVTSALAGLGFGLWGREADASTGADASARAHDKIQ